MTRRAAFVLLVLFLLPAVATPRAARAQGWPADPWLEEPVSDAELATFLEFFSYDPELPLEYRSLGADTVEGVRREHLSFQSTPGERVTAFYYHPVTAGAESRPGAIVLHGGSKLGKAAYGGLTARALLRAGFNVLAIDMDHFGERGGELLTTYTEEDKHRHLYNRPATYLQWVSQTVKDVGRSFDFLVREKRLDPGRIALVGFSRGAQVGTIVGGAEDRFAAVALLYGGHFDRAENEHRAAACPANFIGRISPRPLLLLNGEFDADYDKERSVLPLHRLAREPVETRWLETGHTLPPPEALQGVAHWLAERVR